MGSLAPLALAYHELALMWAISKELDLFRVLSLLCRALANRPIISSKIPAIPASMIGFAGLPFGTSRPLFTDRGMNGPVTDPSPVTSTAARAAALALRLSPWGLMAWGPTQRSSRLQPGERSPDLPSHRYAGITPAIENVVMRVLEKQPYKRYCGLAELRLAIEEAVRLGDQPAPSQIDTGVGPRIYVHAQFNESGPQRASLTGQKSINGLIYGATQAHISTGPIDLAVSAGVSVIIDPETHRLARSDFSRTKGLVALPYAEDSVTPLQPEHLMAVDDYQALARKVIDHQLYLRSDVLIAPYFHFADLTSPHALRQGIPGRLTADSARRASLTRAVATGGAPPLHRRRCP
jgi:hypothetical protein